MSDRGIVLSGTCPGTFISGMSGKCLVGELSYRGPVRRVTIHRGTIYRGSVPGEVFVGEVSSQGNVRLPFISLGGKS